MALEAPFNNAPRPKFAGLQGPPSPASKIFSSHERAVFVTLHGCMGVSGEVHSFVATLVVSWGVYVWCMAMDKHVGQR